MSVKFLKGLFLCGILTSSILASPVLEAQVGVFTKEALIEYTAEWKGERFPDGRPMVSDDILKRMEGVAIEEAWAVTERYGYKNQFEGGWVNINSEPVLVGRAVTAYYHPLRPDINGVILAQGEKDGRIGGQNSWIIDTLVPGDVIVADLFGKVQGGTFLGDNLANAIYAKSGGKGVVIDGGARDIEGVMGIEGYPIFNRGWDPSFLSEMMLMGINAPTRIGRTVVMPGDVVLGKKEGVIFIPAHLALEVVETSELVRIRDKFGHARLRAGIYTPGQIDRKWSPEMEKDFADWVKEQGSSLDPAALERLLRSRTW